MRTLRDLLTTCETWTSRAVTRAAIAKARTEEQGRILAGALARDPEVSALDALTDAAELMSRLTGWQWQAMHTARIEGATWDEIGIVTGRGSHGAREHYREIIDRQERVLDIDVSEYREVL